MEEASHATRKFETMSLAWELSDEGIIKMPDVL